METTAGSADKSMANSGPDGRNTAAPVGMLPGGPLPVGMLPVGPLPVGMLPVGTLPVGMLPVGTLPVGMLPVGMLLVGMVVALPVRAAEWTASAAVVGSSVEVSVAVRLSGCAGIGRIERQEEGAESVVVWQGDDTHAVDTAEPFDACKCEPLGTAWGTGMKSCPEEQCGKDDQCVCTEVCVPVADECPPPGMLEYVVFDRDGNEVVSTKLTLPELLPGCTEPEPPEPAVAEPSNEGGGGCRTVAGPMSPLALLVGLLVLGLWRMLARYRGPAAGTMTVPVVLIAAIAAGMLGCARGKKDQKVAAAPQPPQPVESSIEGTPFEAVVSIQTELLDLFETGTSADSVLWRADRFRKKKVEKFGTDCRQALDFYAQDAGNRMLILASAGRAWTVVEQRVKAISSEWSPAQRRQAEVLLDQFVCR